MRTTDLHAPLDRLPDPLTVPVRPGPFDLTLRPPGSKSVTNRLYVLAALARGTSVIRRPLRSDDCDRLLGALRSLGVEVRWTGADGTDVEIDGVDGRFPRGGRVDLGDGGTPTRFMIAAATLAAEPVIIDGSPRMRERPVAEGVGLLRSLGADVRFLEADGRLPLEVRPSDALRGGRLRVGRTASSQFVSALLLVAPWLDGGLELEVAEPLTSPSYVELTAAVLAERGLGPRLEPPDAGRRPGTITLPLPPAGGLAAFEATVEPDASGAIYWLAAAAVVPGSVARVAGLDVDGPQPDARAARAVAAIGPRAATVRTAGEPTAVFGGGLAAGGVLDAADWPDGALAVAAMAAAGSEPVTITGLRTLRVKETDRIAALATELERIGCTVASSDDHLAIDPSTRHDRPVLIETYDDHRMAMAFAVLGLARPEISIRDPACVAKSYPGFWRDLARVLEAPPASAASDAGD